MAGFDLSQIARMQAVPHTVPQRMSDEGEAEMLRRAADEEAYKRGLLEKQNEHNRCGRALEIVVNLTQGGVCQAEAHAVKEDLDLARETRRKALLVLKSYLEVSG